jgi:hypothetical protein
VRALLPLLPVVAAGVVAAPNAQAATCHDATSSFTKLRSISCAQAKQVVAQARRDGPPYLPECPPDAAVTWHGWRFTAVGTLGIDVVVRKGARSFHFGGGGACG